MPEPTPPPDELPIAHAKRGIRWDAMAAVIASLVGLLALIVGGYTAWIQRQQVRAEVWPYLMWASSDTRSEYMWINKGVGPAIVKSVQVSVAGKPQRDWKSVMQALDLEPMREYRQSSFNRTVLSAGETLEWLVFPDHAKFQQFRVAAHAAELDFKVCYCSTLGECWIDDTAGAKGHNRSQVGKCPAIPESSQFQD